MPYMDRPCDTQPGMKHRCTNAAMEYFRAEVMEMCHDAGLYQIDLLNGSKTRITEREYWAKKKGQLALDEENAVLAEQGLPIKQTKFETDKDKLREEIRKALSDAVNKDGHLTVRNYCAMALPQITVTLRSGRTIYRFNGSYDGTRSLPAKVLEHMAKDANRD